MAKLTISEAIKRAPVGRSQFYAKYVDGGLISISVDTNGKKYVESSELLRCFGEIKPIASDCPPKNSPDRIEKDTGGLSDSSQSDIIELLKNQLEKAEKREEKYLEHIASLTLRLEPPSGSRKLKHRNIISRWWYGLDKDEV